MKSLPSTKFEGKALYQDFPDKKISLWSWNVNGINAVIERGDFQKFMNKVDPIILCLNEIRTDYEKLERLDYFKEISKEYAQYWNCCKVKKGYAGTAIFTKVKPTSVSYDLGISKHDGEGRVTTVEFKDFILVCAYVPNAGSELQRLNYRVKDWDRDFQAYLIKLKDKGKPVILTGDLNVAHEEIDIFNPKNHERSACFTP